MAVARVAKLGGLMLMPAVGSTWLTFMLPDFMRFAGLIIDHVMAKGDILVHSVTMGEQAGSYHRPLLVEFSLRDSATYPEDRTTETVLTESDLIPCS